MNHILLALSYEQSIGPNPQLPAVPIYDKLLATPWKIHEHAPWIVCFQLVRETNDREAVPIPPHACMLVLTVYSLHSLHTINHVKVLKFKSSANFFLVEMKSGLFRTRCSQPKVTCHLRKNMLLSSQPIWHL